MLCPKSDKSGKCFKICPVSFGLAIGIVSFFAVFIWSLWVMVYGMPPMMEAMHVPMPTIGSGLVRALLALLKGFLFGFFVALIYDLLICCKCKKSDGSCETSSLDKK